MDAVIAYAADKGIGVPVLAVGAVVALSLVVAIILGLSGSGKKKLPPKLACFPVIGGVLKFIKGPIYLMHEGYKKHGSIFRVPIFHRNVTFLLGPDVISNFLKAPDSEMSQEEVYKFNVPTFGKGVVFDVDHATRAEQFRFFAESLKSARLKSYVDIFVQEAEAYFKNWGEEGEIDLKEELSKLIILTASRCLLGREVRENMFEQVASYFHDLDLGMLPISVIAPYLPIEAHRRRDRARVAMSKLFAGVIKARRDKGVKEDDMLQTFMDARYKDGRALTDDQVTGMLIAALFAGQHTSSITSTWTGLHLMASDRKFLNAVLAEQKELMAAHGPAIDFDILQKMDNLHRAVKEAIRLNPPLIMLMRTCLKEFTIIDKTGREVTIPKNEILAASPTFMMSLPECFSNPTKFDPDRFAPGREEDKASTFNYIGFGGGRHGCMGENFAYLQIKSIWSVLLRNFEFELKVPLPEPDFESMVIGPKGACTVHYRRRSLGR
eukprot:jgi/Mesvir1/5939/Mv00704-RA.1